MYTFDSTSGFASSNHPKCYYHILPNKCTYLNKHAPQTFYFDWTYLRNSLFDLNHILITFRGPHLEFHGNQTRVRVRFLSPCPARLFGEIRYANALPVKHVFC